MIAIEFDLSDDHVNSDVVDHLGHDLLVERLTDSDSSIFRGGLKKAMRFGMVRKILAKRVFLHLRYAF
jgi:hypothetical protein